MRETIFKIIVEKLYQNFIVKEFQSEILYRKIDQKRIQLWVITNQIQDPNQSNDKENHMNY